MQTDIVGVDQVKGMKPAEVRQALCDAGLSPVGDKNELLKRLAVHYSSISGIKNEGLQHNSVFRKDEQHSDREVWD